MENRLGSMRILGDQICVDGAPEESQAQMLLERISSHRITIKHKSAATSRKASA